MFPQKLRNCQELGGFYKMVTCPNISRFPLKRWSKAIQIIHTKGKGLVILSIFVYTHILFKDRGWISAMSSSLPHKYIYNLYIYYICKFIFINTPYIIYCIISLLVVQEIEIKMIICKDSPILNPYLQRGCFVSFEFHCSMCDRHKPNFFHKYILNLEPKWGPCFGWSLGLVFGGKDLQK